MVQKSSEERAKCTGMAEIRSEIDRIDHEVISLLGERYAFVKAASKFKKSPEQVKAQSRFDAMLKKRRAWAEEQGLSSDLIEKIYRELVNWFISEEMKHWAQTRPDLAKSSITNHTAFHAMVKTLSQQEDRHMIVRTWHGCVPCKHAEGFANHLQRTGVEHSERTPGNLGAYVRRETQGEWEHFFLATYWKDLEAVKAFAGEQYQVAVTYPDDEQFELLSDPYVFQHDVQAVSSL